MDLSSLESKISELEKQKSELLEKIKAVNRRLRHKRYEQKNLQPFVEETKDVHIGPLRKMKEALEFRIATQAYTPQLEREWIKEVKKVDEKLGNVREIEWARRKIRLVEGDISECEKEIGEIEPKLHQLREELNRLYDQVRSVRSMLKRAAARPAVAGGFEDDLVTLGDIGIMENEQK